MSITPSFAQHLCLIYDSSFGSVGPSMSEKEQNAWKRMTSVVSRHEEVRKRIDWTLKGIVIVRLLWTLLSELFLSRQCFQFIYSSIIRQACFLASRRLSLVCGEPKKRYVQSAGKTSNVKTFNVQNLLNPGTIGRL